MMGGFNIYQAIGVELQKADQLAAARAGTGRNAHD